MELFLRKAISLFCVLCVITEVRGEYVPCMTPSEHKGNCIPLTGCPSLSRLANNTRRTWEQTDYLQNSLCGPISNNPFVCCPVQKPPPLGASEALPEIESLCQTPDGKTGNCVLLKSCGVLLDLLRKTNLTNSQISHLKNSKCGDANGKVLVCCPETESPTQTVHQKTTSTTTPQLSTAITVQPKTISKPTVHIAMSPMGNESCRTPDHKLGVCIEIEECPPLKKIILKNEITKIEYNLLVNSKCGEYGSPKICCPQQNDAPSAPGKMLTRNFVFPGSECRAANGVPGICKMSRDCPNANEFEQNSQCGYLGGDSQICCPINMLEKDLHFPTTTQITRFPINTTPLPEVSCHTPANTPGKCISIKSCSSLLEIVTKQDRTPVETMFLQKSQCGYDSGEFMVCCPETKSTTPIALHTTQTTTPTTTPTTAPTPVTISPISSIFGPNIEPPKENTNKWTNEPGCGRAPLQNRIYGGSAAHIDEYIWAARIIYIDSDNNYDIFCGGSLINQNYVLTAAHCVVMPKDKNVWYVKGVRLGEWNSTAEKDCEYFSKNYVLCAPLPVDIDILDYIVHPMYNKKKFNYDIALLKLEESVTYTDFIKPICLPSLPADQQTINYENKSVEVVGWGKTETGEHSEIKLKANLKVKDINKCGLRKGATENQICAKGEKGTDSCNGDSGGPLMLWQETAYYLIGVISFGSGGQCGDIQTNGIYMRVENFMEWIVENTQNP